MEHHEHELPQVLTVEEVGAFLRIGRSAAYQLCRLPEFPAVRVGKLVRIPRDRLLLWLSKQHGPGTQ